MNAVLVGASAGVGRALSEELAAKGYNQLLVASDARDLQAQARHLRAVYGIRAETAVADAFHPAEFLAKIRSGAEKFGPVTHLFIPIGISRSDDNGSLNFEGTKHLIDVNLVAVMGVVDMFLPSMMAVNNGYIVGFGSIAAIRGRRRNVVYSAAKRGLESYFESLRHITSRTDIRVQFYKLGYLATQQSFGKNLILPSVEPRRVARVVVRGLERSQGTIYFPRYWSYIAKVVSALPWSLFRRLDF